MPSKQQANVFLMTMLFFSYPKSFVFLEKYFFFLPQEKILVPRKNSLAVREK